MGDVYGILDGAIHCLGRAVMSKQLIQENTNIKIVKDYKMWPVDVVLHLHNFNEKLRMNSVF